jgi:AraC family transcriptional activator of tynA and feaB
MTVGNEEDIDLAGTPEPLRASLVQRWSTRHVRPSDRLEYFASALSEAVIPFAIDDADPMTFHADLSVAALGAIEICKTIGSAHRAFRGPAERARSNKHKISLLMGLSGPWIAHHRVDCRLGPGDILFHDSDFNVETDVRQPFQAINIALSEDWLRQWVANPVTLIGKHFTGKTPWGRALSAYLAELSPEFVLAPPLPLSVLSDQVGSLLALAVQDLRQTAPTRAPVILSLHERILDILAQRCTESQLTAADVAASLNISLRTLHRALAAANETFGAKLIEARATVALRMLRSALFARVTTAEIGRRAGFVSASHFARVVRNRTGLSPRQIRQTRD